MLLHSRVLEGKGHGLFHEEERKPELAHSDHELWVLARSDEDTGDAGAYENLTIFAVVDCDLIHPITDENFAVLDEKHVRTPWEI